MKVCVIGAGPSGLYVSKFLASYVDKISIFEKSKAIGGHYKYSQNPKMKSFLRILENRNVNLITNYKINKKTFPKIEKDHDVFILATGGKEKYFKNKITINGLDILKNRIDLKSLGNNVCILGMGNVSLDIIRKIYKFVSKIDVFSRSNIMDSKFTINEMRDLINQNVFKIKIKEDKSHANIQNNRRYEMFKDLKDNNSNKILNLFFNANIKDIIKAEDKIKVCFDNEKKINYDSVITSFGFVPKKIKLLTKKPIFKIGWCVEARGNISNALIDAKKLAEKIIKKFNLRKNS